jgi:glyoxylase-like metal-dependent hydrolase (beta-lactamase superfamily II)
LQVYESVHKIELNLPFQETPVLNVYVIRNGSSAAIIDTGMGDAASNKFLIKSIEELGLRKKDVSFVINTHEHIEHFSGNHDLVEATGARIVAHPIAKEYIESPSKRVPDEYALRTLPEGAAQQLRRWGALFSVIKPSKVAKTIEDGDIFEPIEGTRLRVVHTPGHAQGHVCLYDEERKLLFSGDQVLGSGTPYVGKWPDDSNGDMDDYLASLERLKKLDMELILPGHGPTVTEPYERIDETIERKMRREALIVSSLRSDRSKDLLALTKEVYGSPPEEIFYYSSCVLAYLSRLKKQGRVEYSINGFNIQCKLAK